MLHCAVQAATRLRGLGSSLFTGHKRAAGAGHRRHLRRAGLPGRRGRALPATRPAPRGEARPPPAHGAQHSFSEAIAIGGRCALGVWAAECTETPTQTDEPTMTCICCTVAAAASAGTAAPACLTRPAASTVGAACQMRTGGALIFCLPLIWLDALP